MIYDKTFQLTRIIQGFTERFLKIFLGFDLLANVIPGFDNSTLQFTIYTINFLQNKVGIKGKIRQGLKLCYHQGDLAHWQVRRLLRCGSRFESRPRRIII